MVELRTSRNTRKSFSLRFHHNFIFLLTQRKPCGRCCSNVLVIGFKCVLCCLFNICTSEWQWTIVREPLTSFHCARKKKNFPTSAFTPHIPYRSFNWMPSGRFFFFNENNYDFVLLFNSYHVMISFVFRKVFHCARFPSDSVVHSDTFGYISHIAHTHTHTTFVCSLLCCIILMYSTFDFNIVSCIFLDSHMYICNI